MSRCFSISSAAINLEQTGQWNPGKNTDKHKHWKGSRRSSPRVFYWRVNRERRWNRCSWNACMQLPVFHRNPLSPPDLFDRWPYSMQQHKPGNIIRQTRKISVSNLTHMLLQRCILNHYDLQNTENSLKPSQQPEVLQSHSHTTPMTKGYRWGFQSLHFLISYACTWTEGEGIWKSVMKNCQQKAKAGLRF